MSTGSNTQNISKVNIQTELTGNEGFYLKLTNGYTRWCKYLYVGFFIIHENFEIVTATPLYHSTPTLTPAPTPTPTQLNS